MKYAICHSNITSHIEIRRCWTHRQYKVTTTNVSSLNFGWKNLCHVVYFQTSRKLFWVSLNETKFSCGWKCLSLTYFWSKDPAKTKDKLIHEYDCRSFWYTCTFYSKIPSFIVRLMVTIIYGLVMGGWCQTSWYWKWPLWYDMISTIFFIAKVNIEVSYIISNWSVNVLYMIVEELTMHQNLAEVPTRYGYIIISRATFLSLESSSLKNPHPWWQLKDAKQNGHTKGGTGLQLLIHHLRKYILVDVC